MQRFNPPHQIKTQPVLPDNNNYTWIFDSTQPDPFKNGGPQLAKSAGLPTVGPCRGGMLNGRANITASVTTSDATLVLYTLDGAGAWKAYTHPSLPSPATITAGASPQGVLWDIIASDVLIGIKAGATAPTALATTLYFVERW
jgi:hypothetical protein